MKILRTIKLSFLSSLLVVTGLSATAAATPNTSSYSLAVSGNTVNVYETNSEPVNAVGANFVYGGNSSGFNISIVGGSTFSTCVGGVTVYSLNCATLGSSAAVGTHLVASLTFVPIDNTSDSTITVSMSTSSRILSTADNTDTLNHAALPSITYRYTAPSAQDSTASTVDDGSVSKRTTATTAATGTGNNSGAASTPTPADTPASIDTGTGVKGATTSKSEAGGPKKTSSSHTGMVITSSAVVLLILAAAAYWLMIRRKPSASTGKSKIGKA